MMIVFQFSVDEYTEQKTETVHLTLNYLAYHGHISEELRDQLMGNLVVAAIPNRPGWPTRLLQKFFSKTGEEDRYSFPIVDVGEYDRTKPKKSPGPDSPNVLKLIHDSDKGGADQD